MIVQNIISFIIFSDTFFIYKIQTEDFISNVKIQFYLHQRADIYEVIKKFFFFFLQKYTRETAYELQLPP